MELAWDNEMTWKKSNSDVNDKHSPYAITPTIHLEYRVQWAYKVLVTVSKSLETHLARPQGHLTLKIGFPITQAKRFFDGLIIWTAQ